MEPSTTSAGTQTDTFGEVIDMLSQKDIAIEKLISTKEINFIPENIRDDTQMKCVTSFTIKEFYCIYRFLQIEDDLSMGMIGITPNGAISFISELFTGSISDKEVFIRSKLMDRLEPNDVVMADKGF
ncbi:hypothetical protein TNCV_4598661 [Trichonephila clavipes]|nr:hypothetical protein TNCV_4598661 [Trichonephila clavipes]